MDQDTMDDTIATINVSRNKLVKMQAKLSDAKKPTESKRAGDAATTLGLDAKALEKLGFEQWSKDSDAICAELGTMCGQLQTNVDAVLKTVTDAQKIVDALKAADQVVTQVKKLFPV